MTSGLRHQILSNIRSLMPVSPSIPHSLMHGEDLVADLMMVLFLKV